VAFTFVSARIERTTDAYDRLLPIFESNGHPDLVGFRALTSCLAASRRAGRTAFHDAVARFGGFGHASVERFFSSRALFFRATSDVPVALRLRSSP